jgi:hypothetical protein
LATAEGSISAFKFRAVGFRIMAGVNVIVPWTAVAPEEPGPEYATTGLRSPDPQQRGEGVTMKVISHPPGLEILVDGRPTGLTTPADVPDLDPDREITISFRVAGKTKVIFQAKMKPMPDTPLEVMVTK